MQNRFKIINLFKEKDGCSYVRHDIPFKKLAALGHHVTMEYPIHRTDFNIGILSRAISPDLAQTLVKMKTLGIKLVYDTDDLLFALEPTNPYFSDVRTNMAIAFFKAIFPLVDMVTTTGEELSDEFRDFTGMAVPVATLPNCIRAEDWKERDHKSKRIRVGYAGSISHHAELNFLIPIIRDLKKEFDFEFHIFGIFDNLETLQRWADKKMESGPEVWQMMMRESIEQLKTIEFFHHSYVPIQEYPETMRRLDLDIGLCPLFNTRFNRCKSPIKAFEYAMTGAAVLTSDTGPYQVWTNRADMDPGLWRENLHAMLSSKQYREDLAREQKQLVLDEFEISKNIHRWEEAFNYVLKPTPTILGPDGNRIRESVLN